jgi:capsular polysaccharide biosynthesis protein
MDVLSLLRLLGRHWRVTVPAALVTLLLAGAAFKLSSPTYEATGAILLMSPPEPPDAEDLPESAPAPEVGQNPFTRYGDLSVMADILARVMASDAKRAEFESQGVTDYDVVVNQFQRGPVVDVTGKGPSPEAATRSTSIVLSQVDAALEDLQRTEGADPDYFIKSAHLEPPSAPTAMLGSTMRAAIAALAVGALGTVGIAVLAEALARRRAERPAAGAEMTDAASPSHEQDSANRSRKVGWSGILAALRSAPGEPSKDESARQTRARQESPTQASARPTRAWQESRTEESAQPDPSKHESAWERTLQQEPSKEESAWQGTSQQDPSHEFPADNGHRRATTDRSS